MGRGLNSRPQQAAKNQVSLWNGKADQQQLYESGFLSDHPRLRFHGRTGFFTIRAFHDV